MQQNVVEKCHNQMSSFPAQTRPPRNSPFCRQRRQKTKYTSSLSIAGCGASPEKAREWQGKSGKSKQSLLLYSLLPRNCISLSQIFIAPLGQEQQLVVANALAATDFPSKCGQPQKRSGKVVTRIRALERVACCCRCRRALVLTRHLASGMGHGACSIEHPGQIKISNVWARSAAPLS